MRAAALLLLLFAPAAARAGNDPDYEETEPFVPPPWCQECEDTNKAYQDDRAAWRLAGHEFNERFEQLEAMSPKTGEQYDKALSEVHALDKKVHDAFGHFLAAKEAAIDDLTEQLEIPREEPLSPEDVKEGKTLINKTKSHMAEEKQNFNEWLDATGERLAQEQKAHEEAKQAMVDAGLGPEAKPTDPQAPKDPAKAKEYFDKQLEKEPSNSKNLGARAAANYNLGDMEAACADSKAALGADSQNKQAFGISKLSCGGKMLAGKDFGKAPKVFKTPLQDNLSGPEGDPNATAAAPVAGFTAAAYVPGRTADPQAAYQKAAEAEALLMRGRYGDGIESAKRALALDPNNKAAYSLMAAAYKALRDFRSAANAAEAGLRLDPKNLALLLILADARAKLGDHAAAKAAAERAVLVNPTNATAKGLLAHALGKTGDRKGMLDLLRQAAALDPAFEPSLEEARTANLDADVLFYLPGEQRPAAKAPAPAPDRPARRVMVRFAIVMLSLGVIFGLWQMLGPGLGARGSTAVAVVPEPEEGGAPALLAGKYELRAEIGQGGMGFVYEGYDHKLDRKVAIKRMRPELRSDPSIWERFMKEAKVVSHLSHPYIVGIHDVAEQGDETYLVFDYVDGQTLRALMTKKRRLSVKECKALFAHICPAIDFAHQKLVLHRDLKPANIMVDTGGFAKVMDFGVAREAKDSLSKLTSMDSSGTPAYMAPEQHMGMAGKPADVYSLAVCLYEMLTGQLPFPGPDFITQKERLAFVPPTQLVPGLPHEADLLFAAAFAHDPAKRVATGSELLELLNSVPDAA